MVLHGNQYSLPWTYNVPGSFALSWAWALLLQLMCLPGIDALVAWGSVNSGGNSLRVQDQLTNVDTIYSTDSAFAAKKRDCTVVTWGGSWDGGDSSLVADQLTNVDTIYSTSRAFAAKKTDGTVVTWGESGYGGDSSSVAHQLTNVDTIYSTDWAFAAKKTDGTVVKWGSFLDGGDSSSVADQLTNVDTIYSADSAFAAKKTDGTVVTWGSSWDGGDSSSVADQLTNVDTIYSTSGALLSIFTIFTSGAFAAKKRDCTVVTWAFWYGGDSSLVADQLTNVDTIYSTCCAFAAKKIDGTVVTWGDMWDGGDSLCLWLEDQLTNVNAIYSTCCAFAAKKTDGTVVTWGKSEYGGDSSSVADQLTNVDTIYSTSRAFAAKKTDGTVVTWGESGYGGDSSLVADQLTNVDKIYSTDSAFAAKKTDGTVVTWGSSGDGGDSSLVADQLTNVDTIYSTGTAFAAITACSDAVDISGSCYKCTNNTCTAAICKPGYVLDPSVADGTICHDCSSRFPRSESVEACTSCDASTCKTGVCRAGFHSFVPGANLFCSPCATYAFDGSVANCTACNEEGCLVGICAPTYFDFVAGRSPRCVGRCDELFSHPSVLRCTACSASRCEAGDCAPGHANFSGGPSPTCAACLPGSFFNAASGSCSPCPTGFFSNQSAQTACTLCAAGQFAAQPGRTACSVCPEGHFCALPVQAAVPEPCPPGTFQPGGSLDAVAASSCLACAEGFVSLQGAAVCKPAPVTFDFEALVLAAVCAGLLVLTALFAAAMKCTRDKEGADYVALATPTLALFDVGSDVLFLADLVASQGWVAMAWASLASLCLSMLVVLGVVASLLRCETRSNAEFSAWLENHTTPAALVVLLSLTNAEGLELLKCKVGGFQALSAPLRSESAAFLRVVGLTTNLLEDLPQLCIQIAITVTDGLTTTRLVSLAATFAVIGKGLLTRSFNLIIQRQSPLSVGRIHRPSSVLLEEVDKELAAVDEELAHIKGMIVEARQQLSHRNGISPLSQQGADLVGERLVEKDKDGPEFNNLTAGNSEDMLGPSINKKHGSLEHEDGKREVSDDHVLSVEQEVLTVDPGQATMKKPAPHLEVDPHLELDISVKSFNSEYTDPTDEDAGNSVSLSSSAYLVSLLRHRSFCRAFPLIRHILLFPH
eukprot:g5226.t1